MTPDCIEFQFREIHDVFTTSVDRAMARLIRDLDVFRYDADAFRVELARAAEAEQLRASLRADEARAIRRCARLGRITLPRPTKRTRTCSQASRWMVLQ